MRLKLGTPRSLLVVAPHPDDETIGAFGLMTMLRRRGVRVRALIVSDGGASHPASVAWPRWRLVRERRRESLRALRRVGLSARDVTFLAPPDGGLPAARAIGRLVARAIARGRGPRLVVGPGGDDGHPDHRAVAAAIRAARCPGVRRLSYPVWPVAPRAPGRRGIALTAATRLVKRSVLKGYRTQTGAIRDDPAGFAMSRREIEAFCAPREWFREELR